MGQITSRCGIHSLFASIPTRQTSDLIWHNNLSSLEIGLLCFFVNRCKNKSIYEHAGKRVFGWGKRFNECKLSFIYFCFAYGFLKNDIQVYGLKFS